ncbi:RNA polymerase sigma factor [Pseudonocardia xinjiangensis]|uniref:RNA polymerase sigma factor n=1 Tax=Pseudonocardia xinjiangensis TaxID=75289 RepID=UPI003D8AB8A3
MEGQENPHPGDQPGSGEQGDMTVGTPVDNPPGSDGRLDDVGGVARATPGSGRTKIVRGGPALSAAQLRVDFGAHLEANYQRLVAQLYAITLDPGEAHDVVQDAYSRAWRNWAVISRSPDPSAWIRRVAVRSTIRSWRRMLARIGIGRPRPIGDGVDSRTGALLTALGKLSAAERRAVVLTHMAGISLGEISALEQVSIGSVQARLSRARQVVSEGMAEVLPLVLEGAVGDGYNADDGFDVFGSGERGSDGYGPAYGPGNYRPGDFDAEGYGTPYGGEGDRAGDDYRGEHR